METGLFALVLILEIRVSQNLAKLGVGCTLKHLATG